MYFLQYTVIKTINSCVSLECVLSYPTYVHQEIFPAFNLSIGARWSVKGKNHENHKENQKSELNQDAARYS